MCIYAYQIVLPDSARQRVWMTDGALPFVELESWWPPANVEALAHAVHNKYGIKVRAVRHVLHASEERVIEVESDRQPDDDWSSGAGDSIVDAWRESLDSERRAPWERPGWFASASRTFIDVVSELDYRPLTAPVLVKGAWPVSSVLRLDTSRGRVYFKAGSMKPPREPATLRALRDLTPGLVPELVAIDPNDDWMITADFGVTPVHDHEHALRAFAELQVLVGDSLALPDFTLPALRSWFDLSASVSGLCEELASSRIPCGLVHQDLRAGNVVADSPFRFFDWTDVVHSHPFFSGIRYIDLFTQADPACDWRGVHDLRSAPDHLLAVRDAYLGPFADLVGMDEARRDFELAWALQPLFMAARWDWEQRPLEQGAPWTIGLHAWREAELSMRLPPRVAAVVSPRSDA